MGPPRMPNSNYIKGRKKEYKIRNEYISLGYDIVQRTAGSHSPIDVIAIDKHNKTIKFIQAKPNSWNDKKIKELEQEHKELNGLFMCSFVVL